MRLQFLQWYHKDHLSTDTTPQVSFFAYLLYRRGMKKSIPQKLMSHDLSLSTWSYNLDKLSLLHTTTLQDVMGAQTAHNSPKLLYIRSLPELTKSCLHFGWASEEVRWWCYFILWKDRYSALCMHVYAQHRIVMKVLILLLQCTEQRNLSPSKERALEGSGM